MSVTRGADGNWLVEGATASLNPAWQPLTLASGWAAHASFYTPAVRHNGDGTASLSGLSQLSGALTAGATVATLPAGTWPARQVRVAVQVAAGYFGVLTILTTGEIQLSDFNPAPPSTGNKWTEFDAVGSYRLV
ncbi:MULTISPECIES: hypothetical protein [unclassified Streptomyces]|uniref:hypothetical protein n=1 Tax=unclassified Streptomyces TaxID=2593676 RepID=UPI0033F7B651